MRRLIRLFALFTLAAALAACSTLAGVGRDLTSAAEGISAALTDETRAATAHNKE